MKTLPTIAIAGDYHVIVVGKRFVHRNGWEMGILTGQLVAAARFTRPEAEAARRALLNNSDMSLWARDIPVLIWRITCEMVSA